MSLESQWNHAKGIAIQNALGTEQGTERGLAVSSGTDACPATNVDLTTEVRWFFNGPMPSEIMTWFTKDGEVGLVEKRCDLYRADGQAGEGVKRRNGETLELKLRLQPPAHLVMGSHVDGQIETWQRWSPAGERITLSHEAVWAEVDKTIIKRRFALNGDEMPLSVATRAMTHQGCDVEIATVSIVGTTAWSFAFAAFGPPESQRQSLIAAWRALEIDRPDERWLQLRQGNSFGYPEWLTRVTASCTTPGPTSAELL